VLHYRASDAAEPSEAVEQKPSDVWVTSSVATASAPPPSFGRSRLDSLYI
jgi:hypothetical protein